MSRKRESHKILETFNFRKIAHNILNETTIAEVINNITETLPDLKQKVAKLMAVKTPENNDKIIELINKINELEDTVNKFSHDNPQKQQKIPPLDIQE